MRNVTMIFLGAAMIFMVNCKAQPAKPYQISAAELELQSEMRLAMQEYALLIADYIVTKAQGTVDSAKLDALQSKRKGLTLSASSFAGDDTPAWAYLDEVAALVPQALFPADVPINNVADHRVRKVHEAFNILRDISFMAAVFPDGGDWSLKDTKSRFNQDKAELDGIFRRPNSAMDEAITFALQTKR